MCSRRLLMRYVRQRKVARTVCVIIVTYWILDILVFEHGPKANRQDSFMSDLALNGRMFNDINHIDVNASCKRAALPLWPPELRASFRIHEAPTCNREDWISVHNATIYINPEAEKQHGPITCTYYPITFQTDFRSAIGEGRQLTHGAQLAFDFFEVECKGGMWFWTKHRQAYAGINRKVPPLPQSPPWPKRGFPMNILMIGFDSLSRLSLIRNLPLTYHHFTNELDGVVLEGYNIVGDGTPQALFPILTGRTEEELPEARWGYPGAKELDDHPWIWHDLKKQGYAVQWAEDYISTGAFQYRMKGFASSPVHHYYRTFLQRAYSYSLWLQNPGQCLGSKTRNAKILEWCRQLFVVYPNTPKFSFIFQGELSHNDIDGVQVVDVELKTFLVNMASSGHLDNTMLVLMSDHGLRAGSFRKTQQGKFEERLPFFAIRMPDWFKESYPDEMINLRRNAFRLTSPFDIHATFRHLMDFKPQSTVPELTRGISLLTEVPRDRTCADASIEPHWCACLDTLNIDPRDGNVVIAAQTLVAAINEIVSKSTELCAYLTLRQITGAAKLKPQRSVLKFRYSKDWDGRVADLSGNDKSTETYYQITIETNPGPATFEATMRFDGERFMVDFKSVSRINKYGTQPECIAKQYPHLRPYCYCQSV